MGSKVNDNSSKEREREREREKKNWGPINRMNRHAFGTITRSRNHIVKRQMKSVISIRH